ncbi:MULTISPECIES: hypothetical protein [Kitasatospora]|uniref:Uncharacterized protein n=1 Tax=Kitasatospora setae (strain ATCC 33774 / DSM 43861 / JCM 3304 / KCC A-0304 / NBRC 14216 / KM-6054) TaxID=452652 RepID=E4N1Q8_KITSK|nr:MULTISPECIES: hypothetical protein [Kitasatospora]BAJ32092.1 hypothetical protein KSE_63340 [Kitasatospora setae KM-6054]
MGASGWDYLTPYRGTPQGTLDALHREVFAGSEWNGAGEYESLEELWEDGEFMGTEGTHSILDVPRSALAAEPARDGFVQPLPAARLSHHFGTERPTVPQYLRAMEGDALRREADLRWSGRYVLLYTDGEPTHWGVFGFSGD